MRFLLLIATIGALAVLIPNSYADSNFVLVGNGFGKVNDKIESTSLQMSLSMPDSGKPIFENGNISFGNNLYSIDDASVSLSGTQKIIRITAKMGDDMLSASGKLVTLVGNDRIYQMTGKSSDGKTFSVFGVLKPSALSVMSDDSSSKNDILLVHKHKERVEWKSKYEFTVRTFDPKANPQSLFSSTSGYLEGIQISATMTNPVGEIIKTSSGLTDKFGYYSDSTIIPDNARNGVYTLTVTASGQGYLGVTREFTFVVFPLQSR